MNRFKFILIVLIYLAAHNFFNPLGVISPQLGKAVFYGLSLVGLLYAMRTNPNKHMAYPKKSYRWILIGIIVSILSVWLVYDQPLTISVMATLPYIFAYLYFFILMKFAPDKKQLFKFVEVMVACSLFMYLANLVTVPNVVFGAEEESYDYSRGVVRLAVPMIELIVLYLLYSVNQWVITGKKKWFIGIGIMTFLVVMSVTRQVILLSLGFSFLLIMQRAKLWKKIVVLVVVWFSVSYILPEIPIYKSLMEVSEAQAERNKYKEEDIRITAWRFYTIEYQENWVTQIIGNGLPSIGNSKRGDQIEMETYPAYGGNGCFYVDVGWAGFYWLFGIFATVALGCLLVKASKKCFTDNRHYLFYWFLFILISSIASAPIIFSQQVVSLCICLYLVYGKDNEKGKIYSVNHPQLQ